MYNNVYILGGEQTDFQRNWTKEGKGILAMMREIVNDALTSIKLDYKEINRLNKNKKIGIFVGNFDAQQYVNQGHLGAFFTEIHPSFIGIPGLRYEAACASGSAAIEAAATKIRAGEYDVAIVLGIEIMKTVSPQVGGDFLGTASFYDKEAKGIPFPFPKLFSRLIDIIQEKYSLPEKVMVDALAEISRINYSNAKRNPKAQTRTWFMNKNHALSRGNLFNSNIGGNLYSTDCSQITDGAAIVVLASQNYTQSYSKNHGLKKTPPHIKGWGYTIAPLTFFEKEKESKTEKYILPWTRKAVEYAYDQAKYTVSDIDVLEVHDCFTSTEYVLLSTVGICQPGDEYKSLHNGLIDFQGPKPVNPSGGLIGAGHPVGATGVRMMLDLYKQVTNKAGDYQVENARNGLMLNIGGTATTNIVYIIGSQDT